MDLSRYDEPLLVDASLQQVIARRGVASAGPVLDAGDLAALGEVYAEAIGRYGRPLPRHWFPTGLLEDRDVKEFIYVEVGKVVRPKLAALFVPGATIDAGTFHVKPATPESRLGPHQDVSMVDETATFSLSGWIPLVDTTEANGHLRFVIGSHRFGNVQRSLTMPWAFGDHWELMEAYAEPVDAKAGELILFDTATIHGSPVNTTETPRIAVQLHVRPAAAQLEHLVADDETPAGKVEVYAVPPGYFIDGDITRRPAKREGFVGLRPLHHREPGAQEFEAWCRAGAEHDPAG